MNFRITDNSTQAKSIANINVQRSRLSVLQERVSTSKKINRASDDPSGAEAVINLKTSQTAIAQFQRSAATANQKLTATDDALNSYNDILNRLKTLTTQGLSDTNTPQSRAAIATEIDSLRDRALNLANTKNGNEYVFGGTRQNAAPFDPATAAAATTPTSAQYVQIEPGATAIAVGTTADTVFADSSSTIFADLSAAASALRGTGDSAADKATLQNTMSRLGVYSNLQNTAQVRVGVNMQYTTTAQDQLTASSQTIDTKVSSLESADFAETALDLTNTQNALNATLQATVQGRRSLFDYLG